MNKHINRRRFSASMALTAVATAALLTGCGKVPDTIKIGVAQPLSGPLGALGQDLLNGVKLAVDELNKSGYTVDGKRVTLRPAVVVDQPRVPIAWICHDVPVPNGMELRGKDETDIPKHLLPVECRGPEKK